jgi:predicted transcriptional regulator of viral defense system
MKEMVEKTVQSCIKHLDRPIFTTFELSRLCGKSSSTVIQTLNNLEKQGVVFKIYRGIWAETGRYRPNAFTVVPFLFPRHRAYISFVSALHYYDIIEQIPQVVTIASVVHTKKIRTTVGAYVVHRIHPSFFKGFLWDKTKSFLIAEPEKALIDCLYVSAHKRRYFGHFPELNLSGSFSVKRSREWIMEIENERTRIYVSKRFESIIR